MMLSIDTILLLLLIMSALTLAAMKNLFSVAMLLGIEESMVSLFVLSGLAFVATVASIVWIILWLVRQGDVGSNKYGPDPRTNLI